MRYVAEALGEERVVRRAKEFQDVVGEHQDAVVAEQRLRALAERVPEAALPLGVLIERQRERRARMRGDLPKSWKRLQRAAKERLGVSDELVRAGGAVVPRGATGASRSCSSTGRSTTTGRSRRASARRASPTRSAPLREVEEETSLRVTLGAELVVDRVRLEGAARSAFATGSPSRAPGGGARAERGRRDRVARAGRGWRDG